MFACALGLTVVASPAHAAEADDAVRDSAGTAEKPRLIAMDGALGAGIQSTEEGWPSTLLLSSTVLVHPSFWTAGASADLQGEFFGPSQQFIGGLFGTTFAVTQSLRIDALAAIGAHLEQPSTGLDIFADEEIVGGDTSFALPYAGIRVSPAFALGDAQGPRFLLGTWFDLKEDLAQKTVNYTVESCSTGWFNGEYSCSLRGESYRAGGTHLTAGLRLGVEFGS